MTLELADRSISRPIGVAKDFYVKVGNFHFPADFVVVDFDADQLVELDDRHQSQQLQSRPRNGNFPLLRRNLRRHRLVEKLTGLQVRESSKWDDFLLEEVDAFLALKDDPTSREVDHSYYDTEGDILLLEAFLNDDPSLPLPNQGRYLSQVRKELKIYEAKNDKSSIDEPPEVELKDLPPHLEYAF
uniref:Reverse transcriptase domain-containing protein n=1 Tax=Tanacetum cinerariifolium TaxID=118510 RepID=A0A699KS20_TANCI|nr:reverse transcriptase domain-containing protein [Tanacetum cinerariifolium]